MHVAKTDNKWKNIKIKSQLSWSTGVPKFTKGVWMVCDRKDLLSEWVSEWLGFNVPLDT